MPEGEEGERGGGPPAGAGPPSSQRPPRSYAQAASSSLPPRPLSHEVFELRLIPSKELGFAKLLSLLQEKELAKTLLGAVRLRKGFLLSYLGRAHRDRLLALGQVDLEGNPARLLPFPFAESKDRGDKYVLSPVPMQATVAGVKLALEPLAPTRFLFEKHPKTEIRTGRVLFWSKAPSVPSEITILDRKARIKKMEKKRKDTPAAPAAAPLSPPSSPAASEDEHMDSAEPSSPSHAAMVIDDASVDRPSSPAQGSPSAASSSEPPRPAPAAPRASMQELTPSPPKASAAPPASSPASPPSSPSALSSPPLVVEIRQEEAPLAATSVAPQVTQNAPPSEELALVPVSGSLSAGSPPKTPSPAPTTRTEPSSTTAKRPRTSPVAEATPKRYKHFLECPAPKFSRRMLLEIFPEGVNNHAILSIFEGIRERKEAVAASNFFKTSFANAIKTEVILPRPDDPGTKDMYVLCVLPHGQDPQPIIDARSKAHQTLASDRVMAQRELFQVLKIKAFEVLICFKSRLHHSVLELEERFGACGDEGGRSS